MVNAKISHQNAINGRTNAMIQKLPKNAPKLVTNVMMKVVQTVVKVNAKMSCHRINVKNIRSKTNVTNLAKNA